MGTVQFVAELAAGHPGWPLLRYRSGPDPLGRAMKEIPSGTIVRDTYTIVRFLGRGAFGSVYLARHRYMGLQAMKVFPIAENNDALEEAFVLTRLGHPNIVRAFEANIFSYEDEQLGYFSMEYAEDGMLAGWLSSEPELKERVGLLPQLASGLACAHSQSPPIIHRDIKPSNVLIKKTTSGSLEAKLSDFGLAKAIDMQTKLASAAGTYLYMAPEVFETGDSTASDVYSLGLTFYEILTGRHPFSVKVPREASANTMIGLVRSIRQQSISPPHAVDEDVPEDISSIVMAMLSHDPRTRIQDGVDLRAKLNAAGGDRSLSASDLIKEAMERAKQQSTLGEAVQLLKRAIRMDGTLASDYRPILELWEKGIIQ